ncbi:MAG: L,D-transpeptidase [Chthoniobacterales bacterium]
MGRRKGILLVGLLLASAAFARAQSGFSVEIDLQQQTAYLIRGRRIVLASQISSGRSGHLTETGSFKIIEKEQNHFSTLYGKIVDRTGRTVVADADADMAVPRGGKFIPAPMRYFMRFHAATGMHAGYLPGYPASHGCIRMPEQNAIAFFNAVEVGTPVHVFGRAPTGQYLRYGPQPVRPFYQRPAQPRFDPRFGPPPIPRNDPWNY